MKILRIYGLSIGIIVCITLLLNITASDIFSKDLPVEKWSENLATSWKFETTLMYPMKIESLIGEVEYRSDGTFKRYVTRKAYYYDHPYDYERNGKFKDERPDVVRVGKVEGNWEVNQNGYWKEIVSTCQMKTNYSSFAGKDAERLREYNSRDAKVSCIGYDLEGTARYGAYYFNDLRMKVKHFNKKRIVLEGIDLDEDGKIQLVFERITNQEV